MITFQLTQQTVRVAKTNPALVNDEIKCPDDFFLKRRKFNSANPNAPKRRPVHTMGTVMSHR